MALFQPSQITPDVRSGLGLGVVDATQEMVVSWHINGASGMTYYSVTIYQNNAASTQVYTTGKTSVGATPVYGTSPTGEWLFYSCTIPANTLTNGNEYKLIIQQWWSANDSVTQSSASVFVTRAAPTLSIDAIGTSDTIDTRYYTFSGSYTQAQGDVLNWYRWQIANAGQTDKPLLDTGNISGTMDISCYYDGFFAGTDYVIRLSCQTENGVEADTGWVAFICDYDVADLYNTLTAGCVGGTDAVLLQWDGAGSIAGQPTGQYSISDDHVMSLPRGSKILWDNISGQPLSFGPPWTLIWKGNNTDGTETEWGSLFTIHYADGSKLELAGSTQLRLMYTQNGMTIVVQTMPYGNKTIAVVLTSSGILYQYRAYSYSGLAPSLGLAPGTSLSPKDNNTIMEDYNTYSNLIGLYGTITSVEIGGYQNCEFLRITQGIADANVIHEVAEGTYDLTLTSQDYFLANWIHGLEAGNLDIDGDTLAGYDVYRRQADDNILVKVANLPKEATKLYDYSARSQQGPYNYYLFPIGTSTYVSTPMVSGGVMPCWWNWTLMECAETEAENIYTVLAAYKFRLNVESGAVSNNNSPSILNNFTPYPKVQLAPQNYKSGTLSGLIGVVDWTTGQPKYIDTLAWRDAIYALSKTQNQLFLKNRKGDLLYIRISAPVTMTTADNTREQMQTVSLPWVEVGNADGVGLYSTEYVGVQSAEGKSEPQYWVSADDVTATADEIRLGQTAVGQDGFTVGEATFTVDGTTIIAPPTISE